MSESIDLREAKGSNIAIAHDYLTQRGGAERVVLSMLAAFPQAPLFTSLYEPSETYPEFAQADVRPFGLNKIGAFRHNHRLALPLLARGFSHTAIDTETVLCSSSGWAHGVKTTGRKIVYCHTPARWIYQGKRYLGDQHPAVAASLIALQPFLKRWDKNSAAGCSQYLANSSVVRDRIYDVYGIEAEVVPAPHTLNPSGPQKALENLEPGYFLCVSRLLPYKNVDAVVSAFAGRAERLVVVGIGPQEAQLRSLSGPNVVFAGRVEDDELRWLYANSAGVIAASHEDYGLTPLEAASFGVPSAVLRWGGFLDTMVEGETGVFFDSPNCQEIGGAVDALINNPLDKEVIKAHADEFSEESFIARLRQIVLGEGRASGSLDVSPTGTIA